MMNFEYLVGRCKLLKFAWRSISRTGHREPVFLLPTLSFSRNPEPAYRTRRMGRCLSSLTAYTAINNL